MKLVDNPVLDVSEHPIPTADDLFTQLHGVGTFTKLDLSSEYQQVLLDGESRQYVTITTHFGLYRYTFGVASSPAFVRKIMNSVIFGLQSVSGMLDFIVTGSNDETHFRQFVA